MPCFFFFSHVCTASSTIFHSLTVESSAKSLCRNREHMSPHFTFPLSTLATLVWLNLLFCPWTLVQHIHADYSTHLIIFFWIFLRPRMSTMWNWVDYFQDCFNLMTCKRPQKELFSLSLLRSDTAYSGKTTLSPSLSFPLLSFTWKDHR